jgi:hypothetical protein
VEHYVPLLEFNQRWRVPASQVRVQGGHKNTPAEHEFETACPGPIVFCCRKAVVGEKPDRVDISHPRLHPSAHFQAHADLKAVADSAHRDRYSECP